MRRGVRISETMVVAARPLQFERTLRTVEVRDLSAGSELSAVALRCCMEVITGGARLLNRAPKSIRDRRSLVLRSSDGSTAAAAPRRAPQGTKVVCYDPPKGKRSTLSRQAILLERQSQYLERRCPQQLSPSCAASIDSKAK